MALSKGRRSGTVLGRKLRAAFCERELLIRSNDRVRHIRLGPRFQVGCVSLLALAVAWGAAASGGYFYEKQRLRAQEREVLQAQEDYLALLGEVARYHQAQEKLAGVLQESQEALLAEMDSTQRERVEAALRGVEASRADAVLARSALQDRAESFESELEELFLAQPDLAALGKEIHGALSRSEGEPLSIRTANDGLRQNLEEARRRLMASEEESRNLRERLADRETELQDLRESLAAARQSRDDLEQRRQALVAGLNDARQDAGDWRGEAQNLDERLAESENERERLNEVRQRLNEQVRRLTADLQDARTRSQDLEAQNARLSEGLVENRRRTVSLERERGRLSQEVEGLEAQLASMQDAQQDLVERLSVRAREGIDALEATVESTGLEIEMLLQEAGPRDGVEASGGPLLPILEGELLDAALRKVHAPEATQALEEAVLRLDSEVARLGALRTALTSLPLAEPVDDYWISSLFGMRRDPITGGTARHEGLDFAGPLGSPVYSAGPGRVTHADWKGAYGRMVEIDHGMGIHSRYAHLNSISVSVGQEVSHREAIGALGSSGRSTGPHVHYEILVKGTPYDPMNFVKAGEDVFKD